MSVKNAFYVAEKNRWKENRSAGACGVAPLNRKRCCHGTNALGNKKKMKSSLFDECVWLPSHFPPVPFVPHALCHQYAPPLETVFQKDLRLKVNICGNFGIRSYVSKYWGFNIKTLRSREIKKGLKECFGNYCCSVDFDDAKLVPWGERQLLRLTPTLENRIGFQSVSLNPV